MTPELSVAAVLLVVFLVALLVHDRTVARHERRLFALQTMVFVAGAILIVFPAIARTLARLVGIGRGVDFVLYPTVIWLVRESLALRRKRLEDDTRFVELARSVAISNATRSLPARSASEQ
jgi:hypothetical protein